MTRTLNLLKPPALKQALVTTLCVSLLFPLMPRKAQAQTAIEYAVLLALIRIVVPAVDQLPPQSQQPAQILIGELTTAIENASAAQTQGSVTGQISALDQAIGVETALQGLGSQCADCSAFNSTLQEIIDVSTAIRATLTPHGR